MVFLNKSEVEVCQNFHSFMYLVPSLASVLERKKEYTKNNNTLHKHLISIFHKYSGRPQTPAHQESEQNYTVMTLTNRAVKQLKESDYNYMLLIR